MNKLFSDFGKLKVFFVVTAVLIAVASLWASRYLTKGLVQQERSKMQVWAEAMKSLSNADGNTDMSLVLKVLNENNSIPVVVTDDKGSIIDSRNIKESFLTPNDSVAHLKELVLHGQDKGNKIKISLTPDSHNYIYVYYDDSVMLKRLQIFPYIQIGVVGLVVFITILAFFAAKRAEQNNLWIGLSKETAHQLGTPISSLMAWTTILRENYPNDELIPEMDKDVARLQLIAERFSKIGSVPELSESSLNNLLKRVQEYMQHRVSKRITIETVLPNYEVKAVVSAPLLEWVIENLCKNAVDAIGDVEGKISMWLFTDQSAIYIEVKDTGKGMKKSVSQKIFQPGFTTKKRGWGLGLSLAKRIVTEYHHGKIEVKDTEIGSGTTFRITLKK